MASVKVARLQPCGSAFFVPTFKGSKWIANSSLTSNDGTSVSGLYFNHPQARYFGISTDLGNVPSRRLRREKRHAAGCRREVAVFVVELLRRCRECLLQQVSDAESSRLGLQTGLIQCPSLNSQDTEDIIPLPIGEFSTEAEPF